MSALQLSIYVKIPTATQIQNIFICQTIEKDGEKQVDYEKSSLAKIFRRKVCQNTRSRRLRTHFSYFRTSIPTSLLLFSYSFIHLFIYLLTYMDTVHLLWFENQVTGQKNTWYSYCCSARFTRLKLPLKKKIVVSERD